MLIYETRTFKTYKEKNIIYLWFLLAVFISNEARALTEFVYKKKKKKRQVYNYLKLMIKTGELFII